MAHTLFRFAVLAFMLAVACFSLSGQQEKSLFTIEGTVISSSVGYMALLTFPYETLSQLYDSIIIRLNVHGLTFPI